MGDKLKCLRDHFFDSPKKKVLAIITGLAIVGVGIGVAMHKPVDIKIGDKLIKTSTMMGTVQDVLEKNGITLEHKDKIVPKLDTKLSKNDVIEIKRAQEIVLLVDGKEKTIKTAEDSVSNMLDAEDITLDDDDRVEPALDTKIEKGQKIEVIRVEQKVITENQEIDFEVATNKNKDLEKGVKKTVQEGVKGEREITSKHIYENGEIVLNEVISDKVITEPVNKIIEEGTKEKVVVSRKLAATNSSSSSGSNSGSGTSSAPTGKTLVMESTAYYTGTVTATGTTPRRNPNGLSTVAVDPRVIPLGSKLYIEGYGYAVAEDTGGAVKNNIVDVFLNTKQECLNWGRRNVNVTIVAYPGQW